MKTKITLFACIASFMLHSFSTFSQWVNCPNTFSLHGYSLGVKGTDIWTGTQSAGLFKSTNDGVSFISSDNGISEYAGDMNHIFISGNNIFVKQYRSSDNGNSWELKNTGLSWAQPAPFIISNITQIGNTLYIGTSNGAYQSTDDGDNWSEVIGNWSTLGLTSTYIRVLKSNNGILYAGTGEGLFLSSDNGITWTTSGLGGYLVKDIGFKNNTVFCLSDDKVHKSEDNCITFTISSDNVPLYSSRKMLVADNKILIAGDGGFCVYDIASEVYVAENTGLTANNAFSLVISGDNVFIGVLTHGIFKRALSDLGVISTASIEEKTQLKVELFPNPTNDNFQLNIDDYEGAEATLHSTNGTLVHSFDITSSQTKVDISFLDAGVYLLNVKSPSGISTIRILKN